MSNENGCVYTNVVAVVAFFVLFVSNQSRLVSFVSLYFSGFCVVQKSLHLAKRESSIQPQPIVLCVINAPSRSKLKSIYLKSSNNKNHSNRFGHISYVSACVWVLLMCIFEHFFTRSICQSTTTRLCVHITFEHWLACVCVRACMCVELRKVFTVLTYRHWRDNCDYEKSHHNPNRIYFHFFFGVHFANSWHISEIKGKSVFSKGKLNRIE